MAERKAGRVASCQRLSSILSILRVLPQEGSRFPDYTAGQYIALRREDCRLTRREVGPDGRPHYVPDLDETGRQKIGPVTHSYSIASAPFETRRDGHLEFYVVLELGHGGEAGRLTESLFRVRPEAGDAVGYVDHIAGDFTLAKRAAGLESVLFVGTGTGVAPFVSMLKQLDHEAGEGARPQRRYTLLHANRARPELAYHDELRAIEAAKTLDFVYVASTSRPTPEEAADDAGSGRANNLLRHVFEMPLKEEEDLEQAASLGGEVAEAERALERAVMPRLPGHVTREGLRKRLDPGRTVVLTCGNPQAMSDIRVIAERNGMRFEKEDWKVSTRAPDVVAG